MKSLCSNEWTVRPIRGQVARQLVERYHYTRSSTNGGIYSHGLFRKGQEHCLGATIWLIPTRNAARATAQEDWHKVICLSRLVVVPEVPKNACSFLLSRSRQLIDPFRWSYLITYADEMQKHTGAIYLADNWTYVGDTQVMTAYGNNHKIISRRNSGRGRRHQEMLAIGAKALGRFKKRKFVMTARMTTRRLSYRGALWHWGDVIELRAIYGGA